MLFSSAFGYVAGGAAGFHQVKTYVAFFRGVYPVDYIHSTTRIELSQGPGNEGRKPKLVRGFLGDFVVAGLVLANKLDVTAKQGSRAGFVNPCGTFHYFMRGLAGRAHLLGTGGSVRVGIPSHRAVCGFHQRFVETGGIMRPAGGNVVTGFSVKGRA